MSYVGVVRQLSAGEQVPSAKLRRHAQRLLDRVEAAQAALRALLSEELQRLLGLCNWPPPLSLGSVAGGTPAAAAAAASSVFEAPGVEAVQRLLVVLLTLQRAAQHEQFQVGPGCSGACLGGWEWGWLGQGGARERPGCVMWGLKWVQLLEPEGTTRALRASTASSCRRGLGSAVCSPRPLAGSGGGRGGAPAAVAGGRAGAGHRHPAATPLCRSGLLEGRVRVKE